MLNVIQVPTVGDLRLLLRSQSGEKLGMLGRHLSFLTKQNTRDYLRDILQPNLIR